MNEIVKGYLLKFANDEFSVYRDLPESRQFEHFMNHIIIKRDFLDDFDLDCVHTGGGMDNGIDGIAVVVNNELVSDVEYVREICKKTKISVDFIFIQSKTSNRLDNGDVLKFFDGVFRLFEKGGSHSDTNEEIAHFLEIKKYLMQNSSVFQKNPTIYLKYVYNGVKDNLNEINNNINNYKNRFERLGLFSKISIEILDSNDIQNIYKEIMLNVEKTIKLERMATIPQIDGVQESYIGLIPLTELIKLILDDDGRIIKSLFYDNVRDFQGNTTVNKEIIETMRNRAESQYFGLYHNGITIVAKTLQITGESVRVSNFQIVNGCQTSHIIAENRRLLMGDGRIKQMFIPIKLIATENNNIINSVIKTTNRHNEVKKEAFESLEEFHKRLEDFYNAKNTQIIPKIYYERRSKQYIYSDDIKKKHIITLAEQVKTYLSMFGEIPHSTHRYYGELLDASREKHKLFQVANNKEHFELYHIAGLTFIKFNAFIENHKIDFKYRYFRYHILLIFKLIAVGNLSTNSTKKDYESKCNQLYSILSNDSKLYDYFNKCCNIVEKAKGRANPYGLNRKSHFTDKIINICKTNRDIKYK